MKSSVFVNLRNLINLEANFFSLLLQRLLKEEFPLLFREKSNKGFF